MTAWYNELDPFKAQVIREAIKAGAVADGVVDERSIKDVHAADLVGYTQCHFFAGGGFWSLALRNAGWPDDRPVWTGSCPCPSFSAAGKGGGFDDPRHLWPDWEKLIRVCRPPVLFGEQADDSIGYGWLDLVQTDLEAQAYAVGKVVLGTCSVGGADIRQRLYFVAQSQRTPEWGGKLHGPREGGNAEGAGSPGQSGGCGSDGGVGNPERKGLQECECGSGVFGDTASGDAGPQLERGSDPGGVDNSAGARCDGPLEDPERDSRNEARLRMPGAGRGESGNFADRGTGPLKGFWRDCDWIHCRPERGYPHGRWRPVEGGTFPLAHGDPCRLGRLRLYGDAINIEVATAFIKAHLETGYR